jgi:pimeloyl-ACP methyl ester carboxylesterase
VLARQDGPAIVADHSYGGQIITALGADAPNVAGLVYIAAFGLDEGESIGALLSQGPPSPALAHLIINEQGFAWLPVAGSGSSRSSSPTSSASLPLPERPPPSSTALQSASTFSNRKYWPDEA